jgi:hypothetical protein
MLKRRGGRAQVRDPNRSRLGYSTPCMITNRRQPGFSPKGDRSRFRQNGKPAGTGTDPSRAV